MIRSSRVHRSLGLMSWCQLENPLEHHWLGPLVHSDVASRPFFSADNSSAASPLRGNVTRMVVVEGPPPLAPLVQFAVLLAGCSEVEARARVLSETRDLLHSPFTKAIEVLGRSDELKALETSGGRLRVTVDRVEANVRGTWVHVTIYPS